MSRGAAWSVHLSALAVGGTGLVYGWMRYLCEPADEFSLVNHPAQPLWQHLHLLGAPMLVFACALVWSDHVWRRVRSGFPQRRTTGLVLFALFFPMALSGALVQIAEDELPRRIAIALHAGSGGLWCLAYGVHLLTQARRGNTGPSPESTDSSKRLA